MNRISCEICGSSDLIKQDGVFVCQACGCKYSSDEIKKQLVEVVGSVQVEGVENADALYSKALDWLNLNNNNKAIETLEDMVNKYPGDKRGWQKLARLKPEKDIVENALRFGDIELISDLTNIVKTACHEVRNGQGEKWIQWGVAHIYHANYPNIFIFQNSVYGADCIEELLAESRKNAEKYNSMMNNVIPYSENRKEKDRIEQIKHYYSKALHLLWGVKYKETAGFIFGPSMIIGNLMLFNLSGGGDYGDYQYYLVRITEKILTESVIKQSFIDISKMYSNNVCPLCGKSMQLQKRVFKNEYICTKCKYVKQ